MASRNNTWVGRKNSVITVFSGPRVWDVLRLFLWASASFLALALFSYSHQDPSLFAVGRDFALNWCGRFGATLAAGFLQSLGVAAFGVPLALAFVGFQTEPERQGLRMTLSLLAATVCMLSFGVLLTLHYPVFHFGGGAVLTGGYLGAWLAEQLLLPLNRLGATWVIGTLFLASLAIAVPYPILSFLGECLRTLSLGIGVLSARGAVWGIRASVTGTARMASAMHSRIKDGLAQWQAYRKERIALEQKPQEKKSKHKSPPVAEAVEESFEEAVEESREVSTSKALAPVPLQTELPLREATPSDAEAPSAIAIDISALKRSVAPPPATKMPRARGGWKLPTLEFLRKVPKVESNVDRAKLVENSAILTQKFLDFGIDGEITAVRPGPVITLYEFKPGPGVKLSRIASLADDLSMALSAKSVRILAPLPGKAVVGIEIPSDHREKVYLKEFLQGTDFSADQFSIPVVMGKDIGGVPVLSDLARMPHLLVAGQTGSGKSVFMNGLICSLLYRFTPDELRMILVDPKFIEFRAYQDIPHLLLPVVDDPRQASIALKWAVREMERRYRILASMGARNLAGYNVKVDEMGSDVVRDLLETEDQEGVERSGPMTGGDWREAFEPDEAGKPRVGSKLPYIVVIIDELADLMMVAKKEVEISIARIAQKARAAGIHLVIATQRPSTDVITGLIKANLPSRVSFQLASYIDSKTILDRAGAERLLGQGDMLFIPPGSSHSTRLHGAYVDDEEINKVTVFLKDQGRPLYRNEILVDDSPEAQAEAESDADPLYEEAVTLVRRAGHGSTSFVQRHLKIGYNRAARLIEEMEVRGVVGPADGARPREIIQ